ncbi:hydroxymethylpyrimidine/phosphomethylpyrimidine kinase [Sedimentimonas flavescens]|uniref:hydroxymethylpyrimidine kinase n=1 Tax=Sedimentimonas flavescens TaxID=2851012 RepID=A0ABT2ZXG7_9RHOB|nr:hydroxymethylpyrimidine/phosphomethylpyrimidine kinase [Sedimentimonas flavescens]MCV2878453.1 hydroxymethylpyrimidine/phosphomethylpyrimidine kinase [Sedimentimonas flavescens]
MSGQRSKSVLLIGGMDSSGGAGLLRDAQALEQAGCHARVAVTAVTAQTNRGLLASQPMAPEMVAAQIRAALACGPIRAVKIGMLGTASIVAAVAEELPDLPIILDPVMATSSGGALLDYAGLSAMIAFLPRVLLLTPNLPELAVIAAHLGPETGTIEASARKLLAHGAQHVLVKGGHAEEIAATDLLFSADAQPVPFTAPRIPKSLRGTGCYLASAIAARLAQGAPIETACAEAKAALHSLFTES